MQNEKFSEEFFFKLGKIMNLQYQALSKVSGRECFTSSNRQWLFKLNTTCNVVSVIERDVCEQATTLTMLILIRRLVQLVRKLFYPIF